MFENKNLIQNLITIKASLKVVCKASPLGSKITPSWEPLDYSVYNPKPSQNIVSQLEISEFFNRLFHLGNGLHGKTFESLKH